VVEPRARLSKVEGLELTEFRIKRMDAFQIPYRSHMGWTVSSAFKNASLSASEAPCCLLSSSLYINSLKESESDERRAIVSRNSQWCTVQVPSLAHLACSSSLTPGGFVELKPN
jgi:hypothetical protein